MAQNTEIDDLFEKLKGVVNNALEDLKVGLSEFSENLEATKKIWIKEDTPAKKTAARKTAKRTADKVTDIRKKK